MARESEWWRPFYVGPWTQVQAQGYPNERTQAEVDFIVQALALTPPGRVLDVPCGEGRHAIELAARGFEVTGVDFNPAALETARARAVGRGVAVEFHEGDMRALPFTGAFDAALCFFGSFGYFSDDDNLRSARAFARALAGGGKLLIDTQVMETVFTRFNERQWAWSGERDRSIRMLEERRWDHAAGRMIASWTFIHPGGRIESAESSIRLYTYAELCELLRTAGFARFVGLETLTGRPFALGARRLCLIAEKD